MGHVDISHRLHFPVLKNVCSWVEVDGLPLEVYGVEQQGSKCVAYVEAAEGKTYVVCFIDCREQRTIERDKVMYVTRLSVDGAYVTGAIRDNVSEGS
ncbi:hypothetical protein JCM11641_000629 [Rhodosporidiobolus odoratus]